MLLQEICPLMLVFFGALSLVAASPIRTKRQPLDLSNVSNGTADASIPDAFNDPATNRNDSSSPHSVRKRAPTTLYLPGCTSILNKSLKDPSVVRKPGPFHLSPEGGLYLTHRLENAEAMARLEFRDCPPVYVNGHVSKFMIATYTFDDTGLRVMDLDNFHWHQHESVIAHLPNWWDNQSLHVIPQTGINFKNKAMYETYLSCQVVIGTLTPAAQYGPGFTDLWSLWVLKMARNDPSRTNPISRLELAGVSHYFT